MQWKPLNNLGFGKWIVSMLSQIFRGLQAQSMK